VVTGHGKYEKKPAAADENGEEYPNGKSGKHQMCGFDFYCVWFYVQLNHKK